MPIRFGTYNIRNGRNGGLKSALRGMSQASMDLGIFQKTKVTDGIYTRGSDGYSVVAMDAPSRHRGGVVVFYRPELHFTVEAVQQFRPNVVCFQMEKGERRRYIVGCYLAPGNTSTIDSFVATLKERPWGIKLSGGGRFQLKTVGARGLPEGRGHRGGTGDGGT